MICVQISCVDDVRRYNGPRGSSAETSWWKNSRLFLLTTTPLVDCRTSQLFNNDCSAVGTVVLVKTLPSGAHIKYVKCQSFVDVE